MRCAQWGHSWGTVGAQCEIHKAAANRAFTGITTGQSDATSIASHDALERDVPVEQ